MKKTSGEILKRPFANSGEAANLSAPERVQNEKYFMSLALRQAQKAQKCDEVPIGAVLVQDGRVIARGHNLSITRCDASAHAEMIALRRAGRKLRNYRLPGTVLYVTLEPCAMCAGALIWARVEKIVYGCADAKAGALGSVLNLNTLALNHRFELQAGVLGEECRALLQNFFRERRKNGGRKMQADARRG